MKSRQEEPTELEWSLVANLEAVATLLRGSAARDLREESLTPGGVTILELAHGQSGATSSGLAQLLGISRQATSKAVQGLVAQGLLEARVHPGDARALRLTVTVAGKKALQRSRARRTSSVARLLEPLGPRDRALLAEMLERVRSAARVGPARMPDEAPAPPALEDAPA
ncbi:MAG: winged helix-turn-helix transcriptional regulator [Deltaproteobacteria bacterium]|nr:winged helix-turn-helix transcriptional regulator [Deltaproteobacteria bacterium]